MEKTTFESDPKTCTRCGLCAADCVCDIIEIGESAFIRPENLAACIRCGHCQAICPTDSITLDGIYPASLAKAEKAVSADLASSIIKNRRSVRHFSACTPDAKLIEKAIGIAAWTPTARNFRDIGFIIYNGRIKVEQLMQACLDVMEKHEILPEVAKRVREGRDALFREAPCLLIAHAPERPFANTDCASVLAALELLLPSFGLSSCWAGYFTAICGQCLPQSLELPKGNRVHGAIMIGLTTVSYKKIPARPMPEIIWA